MTVMPLDPQQDILRVRHFVLWVPLVLFGAMVILSLLNARMFLQIVTGLNDWVLAVFSNAFAFSAFAFVLICLWAALSPLGRVRIGGSEAKPLLSRWNWIAITLTTTIAIGIVFWGTAEPVYHLYTPASAQVEPGSAEAARLSLSTLYMHWTFTPYAIYTVPGLTFALVYYNLKTPYSLSSPFSVLTGKPIPKAGAAFIDSLALLALVFGLSASLGSGILSISGGISRLTDLPVGTWMLAIVAAVIVVAFSISSATGLHRGIRILSDANTKIFIVLIIFVLIVGPTLAIIQLSGQSILQYISEFIPRSILAAPFNERDWINDWTVFYFANWMAWAPLAGLFLGRISRGYTVREYILINLLIPGLFSMIWMSVFGGLTLNIEAANPGLLNGVLRDLGPEHILYQVLDYLPLGAVLALVVIILSFLSYVTAADSNIDVIANLCCHTETADASASPSLIGLKLLWAITVGFSAWVMTSLSGIEGIKMLSNLGGLPSLFIISFFAVVLVMLGTVKIETIRR